MKLFVLGNEDTVLGFSLAGVEGCATNDPETALRKLEEVLARGDVGILAVTPGIAAKLAARLGEIEQSASVPVLVRVPAPGEPLEQPPIRDVVRRALGVRV